MGFRLGMAQCGFPADGDVIAMVGSLASKAAGQGCSLVAFPEDLMSPRPLSAAGLRDIAEPIGGPFTQAAAKIARERSVWLVITMYEGNPAGGAPFNTALAIDDGGEVRVAYRKCHLYDAHGVRESERTTPGDALAAPVVAPFATIGLGICYDLRFPEQARAAALAGCDLMLYPSAWYAGPQKAEHWETLLAARAIENELFVAGICKAGSRYVGRSLVADPLGRVLARAGDGDSEQLLTCEIDLDEVGRARDAMPVFEHRRHHLYS